MTLCDYYIRHWVRGLVQCFLNMVLAKIQKKLFAVFVGCIFGLICNAHAGSMTITYENRVTGGPSGADVLDPPFPTVVRFKIECAQSTPPYSTEVRLLDFTVREVATTTVTGIPENTPCSVTETGYGGPFIIRADVYRAPSVEPYQRSFMLGNLGSHTEAFRALWSPPILNQIRGNIFRGPDTGALSPIAGQITGMDHNFYITVFNAGGYVVYQTRGDSITTPGTLDRKADGEFSLFGVLPDGAYTAVLGGGYPKNT
jgi:hypothetical protein